MLPWGLWSKRDVFNLDNFQNLIRENTPQNPIYFASVRTASTAAPTMHWMASEISPVTLPPNVTLQGATIGPFPPGVYLGRYSQNFSNTNGTLIPAFGWGISPNPIAVGSGFPEILLHHWMGTVRTTNPPGFSLFVTRLLTESWFGLAISNLDQPQSNPTTDRNDGGTLIRLGD